MFHTDNDNEGTPGYTGCRLLHVVEGGDYGWRLREGARCCAPDFDRSTWNGGRPGRLGWVAETGRGAPAGLAVLNSAAFPPSTRNLLVYPDVFRKLVRAYQLKPSGTTYTVDREFELISSSDPLFRPDDAEVGPDGALYVLDWRTDSGGAGQLSGNGKTGRIYRLTWGGTPEEPARPTLPPDRFVKLRKATTAALGKALGSSDPQVRGVATLELIRRRPPPIDLHELLFARETSLAMALQSRLIHTALGVDLPISLWMPKRIDVNNIQDVNRAIWIQKRLELIDIARNARPDDAEKAANLLWASGIVMRGVLDHPQQKRSYALALGHFSGLRRKTEGEVIDSSRFITDVSTALNQLHQADFPALLKGSGDNRARQSRAVSTDLIADRLLVMATDNLSGDPFLRDAFTRGLERIGPAGVEAVVQAVAGKDQDRKNAALFILQGWRGLDGLSALLSEATSAGTIPPDARAGLFKALRELGPAVPPEPIARWLATTKAEPGPRIEAIKVLTAMGPRAMLAVSPIVPGLLADEDGSLRAAALRLASVARSPESKAALVDLIGRADRPAEERRLAVSAVRGYDDKSLVTTFTNALPTASEPALKGELLRALMALDLAKGTEAATALLNDPTRETRAEAIAALGSKLESALTVVRLYNAGKLPRDDFPRVLEAARSHKSPELSLLVAELLKSRLLNAPDLEETKQLEDQVRRLGNPGRGKAVYLDASKGNCASCHRMEGTGGAVGPDLTKVWETLSFARRAESILAPSKEIKEGYATFKVAAKDGRVATGLLLADTPEGVALRDAQGREVRIPASDVEEKGFDKLSLMPEGVVANLSFAELADLLAFLGDRPAQESLRPASPAKP
jgi:putative heme-binding domain-containing protein